MPILFVYGVSWNASGESQCNLRRCHERLENVLGDIKELKISPDKVQVFFPKDQHSWQEGKKVVALLKLFASPERTDEVLQKTADLITGALLELLITVDVAECHIELIHREHSSVCIRSSFIEAPNS